MRENRETAELIEELGGWVDSMHIISSVWKNMFEIEIFSIRLQSSDDSKIFVDLSIIKLSTTDQLFLPPYFSTTLKHIRP